MNLSAELILHVLDKHGLLYSNGMDELRFEGIRLKPENGRCLCLCRGAALTALVQDEDCAFLTVGEPAIAPKHYAVLDACCDIESLHALLQGLFDRFAALEKQLAEAALEPGYTAMIQCAWEMSKKPVILMDGSLRVLALAPDEDFTNDAEWMHMRQYGFASLEGLRVLRESGEFDTLLHQEAPVLYGPGTFANPTVVSSIVFDGACVARISMTGLLGELTAFDLSVMEILTEQISRKLQRDDAVRERIGESPAYSVLHDLLRGMKLDNRLISSRLGGLLGWTGGSYAVLTVPAAATDEMSYKYYAGLLEHGLDCFCVLYEESLTAVLHTAESASPEAETKLLRFLQENGLVGGISYCFEDVSQLHDHYVQAAAALQYGDGKPGLYRFSGCVMQHMMRFFPQEQQRVLVHPALQKLLEQDKAAGSELYETLRVYLENERSLVKTATALFIHRNTLLYRLEKLQQLVELNLEDPDLRLHLRLSYRLLERA